MKKIFLLIILFCTSKNIMAQNVGIGNTTPLMNLHVTSTDSAVALLENTQALNTNIKNALYFKTGSGSFPYTGAIKTIGESTSSARLGLFTYASTSPNQLLERLSITDIGNVGFSTSSPQTDLHVNPNGAGSILIGTNKNSGGYTNLEMGITAQSNSYGFIQATKASGSAYGTLAINESGGNVGIGTSQPDASAKLTIGVNTGIGGSYSGIVATGNGSAANAAIKAVGTNNADALVIDGPIRSLNNNGKVIYRLTPQTSNSSGDGYLTDTVWVNPDGQITILINNPLCNGDPNAMIFYSWIDNYRYDKNYQSYLLYNAALQRWTIRYYYDNVVNSPANQALSLNIMIVK